MSPGTESVISAHSTATTALSVSSGQAKSLRSWEIDENFTKEITECFSVDDAEDWDFHLISAPVTFPTAYLEEIPLNSLEPYAVVIDSNKENADADYVCENTSSNTVVPKILPFPSNSTFSCMSIKSTFCIRKTIQEQKVNKKHFIPREHPKPMSEGLMERMKPFGWQNPGDKIDITFSPMKRFKKNQVSPKKKGRSPSKKKRKRHLTDSSSSLLLDTESSSDLDSNNTPPSPRKKRKKLKITAESPIPKLLAISDDAAKTIIEPFIALNSDSFKIKKKRKKEGNSEKTGDNDSPPAVKSHKKSKKKKKEKKLKKEKKKLKKKKRDKVIKDAE